MKSVFTRFYLFALAIFIIPALIFSVNNSSASLIGDKIEPYCGATLNDFEENFTLEVEIIQKKKWKRNFIAAQTTDIIIPKQSKTSTLGKVTFKFSDGTSCIDTAKIQLNGDWKDHLADEFSSSVQMELEKFNIAGIVQFKLLRPNTRNMDNEIIQNLIARELGLLAPRTKYVDVTWGGNLTKYIFQEVIRKELIEFNNSPESLLIEGDEADLWERRIRKESDRTGIYRIKNLQNFVMNPQMILEAETALTFANELAIYGCPGDENQLAVLDEIYRFDLLEAVTNSWHGLITHNRTFLYDYQRNRLRPILYDSNSNTDTFLSKEAWMQGVLGVLQESVDSHGMTLLFQCKKETYRNLANDVKKFNPIEISDKLYPLGVIRFPHEIETYKRVLIERIDYAEEMLALLRNFKAKNSDEILRKLGEQFILLSVDNNGSVEHWNCKNINEQCEYSLDENNLGKLLSGADVTNSNSLLLLNSKRKIIPRIWKLDVGIIELYGEGRISLDEVKREIRVALTKSSIFNIKEANLDSWTIKVEDTTDSDVRRKNTTYGFFKGCLNVFNSHLTNVSIESVNSSCEDAINVVNSKVHNSSFKIKNAFSDAIDFDFSDVTNLNLYVDGAKNDCIDFSSGNYVISRITARNCGDKAVSAGEGAKVKIDNLIVKTSNIGVAGKDSSSVSIIKGSIDSRMCYAVYRKKQEFAGSYLEVSSVKCSTSDRYQQNNSIIRG
jgi:hypothetical protein